MTALSAPARFALVALLVLGGVGLLMTGSGCGSEDDGGSKAPEPAGVPAVVVADGVTVAKVYAADLTERRLLPEFLPAAAASPATWAMLEVHTTDGRVLQTLKPTERFPKQDFCLYRSGGGTPSFGVYRRDAPDLHPRLRELLDQPAPYMESVARVVVRTVATPEELRFDKLFGTLTAVVDGGEDRPITAAMLAGLPAFGRSGRSTHQGRTKDVRAKSGAWLLREAVALLTDPDAVESVRLVSIKGTEKIIPAKAFAADARTKPVLKRNRKGDHHLRTFEDGRQVSEFRSVVRIEIRTKALR